jgi:DNA topoisomerase IA
MNATRLYTMKYGQNKQVLSIGRVQTPTLALIVNRQQEIENFVPKQYWELKTTYRDVTFSAVIRKSDEELALEVEKLKEKAEKTGNIFDAAEAMKQLEADNPGIDPIPDEAKGQALLESIRPLLFTVTDVSKKPGKEYAPHLFDLTSLQVECNKKFGYSAEDTLRIIQSLYEKKIATYPRVDTTYLSDDIYPKCPGILKGLRGYETYTAPLEGIKLPKSKRVFDNSKVTDHHAIIPTGQVPGPLTDIEKKVYDLIVRRFIAVFHPDCKTRTTTVQGETEGIPFRTSGKEIVEPGWRVVFDHQWTMDNGQLTTVNGQQSADSHINDDKGEQPEENCQLSIVHCPLSIVHCQLLKPYPSCLHPVIVRLLNIFLRQLEILRQLPGLGITGSKGLPKILRRQIMLGRPAFCPVFAALHQLIGTAYLVQSTGGSVSQLMAAYTPQKPGGIDLGKI